MPNVIRTSLVIAGLFAAIALGRWFAIIAQPLSADSVGRLLLQQGRPADAMYVFEDAQWRGVAMYRAGRFNRAIGAFVEDNTVESIYNIGNAYAQLGKFQNAIEVYQRVLEEDPEHDDARFNLDLVRQANDIAGKQQPGDPNETGAPGDPDTNQSEPGDESQARNDDIIQTVNSDPPVSSPTDNERSQEQDHGNPSDSFEQTQSGSGSGNKDMNDTAGEESSLATGDPKDSEKDDETSRDSPIMAGKFESHDLEDTLAEEILLRHIKDEPKVVLRARLRMALERQNARAPLQ